MLSYKMYANNSHVLLMGMQTVSPSGEEFGNTHKIMYIHLSFDSAILLLIVYPGDTSPTIRKYRCARLFVAIFVVSKYRK